MASLYAEIARFDDFLNAGGPVLFAIMAVTFVMWVLISERLLYLRGSGHSVDLKRIVDEWQSRQDQTSWYALQVRRYLVAEMALKLRRAIPLIKTCIAICPLLGLMGTVTGMISVFEVMSLMGGGSPRAMAEGVSRATIPTMAGMVAAISGIYFCAWLERKTEAEVRRTEDLLTYAE